MLKPLTNFVLDTLTNTLIQSVHFRYGSFCVTPDGYRRDVADLVRDGRIRFTVDPAQVGMTAEQASQTDGAFVVDTEPGQTHPLFIHPRYCEVHGGTIYVKDNLGLDHPRLRGTVVHEATHVLQDMQRAHLNPFQAEGAGYVAGAITARKWGLALPPPGQIADPEFYVGPLDGTGVALWIADRILDEVGPHCSIPAREMGLLERKVGTGSPNRYAFNGI